MIRVLREARDLTQEELADRVGLSQIAVSQHERGTREPGWSVIKAYAGALGVDVSLFDDEERWATVAKEQARLAKVTEEVKARVLREARAILEDARNTPVNGSSNRARVAVSRQNVAYFSSEDGIRCKEEERST